MRSAGCIVNDIADKEIDRKVLRTKNRPIASGKISIKIAVLYTLILCLLALFVLLNFNQITIFLALGSMPLAFTYPLMKRFTYWPQLFLGITFNYGLILGWTAIKGEVNLLPLILYFGAIFWTIAYDTIYGFQDIKDDEIIGVKSTSIKFKKNPTYFLTICLLFFSLTLLIIGYMMNFNSFYFLSLLFVFFHLFLYQLRKVNLEDAQNCLKLFKSNNHLGFITYICLLIGKFNL